MFEDNSTLPIEPSSTGSGDTDSSVAVNGVGSDVEPAPKKRGRPRKNPVVELATPSLGLELQTLEVTGHGSEGHESQGLESQGLESQVETAKPKTRGRKAAAVIEATPSESVAVEPSLEPEVVAPTLKARGRKATVSDSSPETPKPRGRKGKTVEAPALEVEEGETTPVVPLELTPEPEPTPVLQAKPKARGRKVASVEPVTEPVKPRVRGRKASLETNEAEPSLESPEVDSAPVSLETDEAPADALPPLEGETAPITAPKRLVRVRKTARENPFESQAKLTNPLEVLLEYLRANPGAHALRDLEKELEDSLLKRLGGRKGLEESLEALLRLGALMQVKRHTYSLAREVNAVVGRLTVRGDGWGVLYPDTPGLREMLIAPNALLHAWHGDRVVARELKRNGESYGRVIRVLERRCVTLVGTLRFARGALNLRPDDSRLPDLPLEPVAVSAGARVVVTVRYPEVTGEDDAFGVVSRILGDADTLETERAATVVKFGLNTEFSSDTMKEAVKVAGVSVKDLQGRVDLRGKRVIAARVTPDAPLEVGVQVEPLGNGNLLIGMHVADAQYFVDEGKALDSSAQARGVAINLAGEKLPLLPEVVLKSAALEVGSDRLAVSVLVEASPDGNVVNYIVRQSVVNAKATLDDGLLEEERDHFARLASGLRKARGGSHSTPLEELLLLTNRLAAATLASNETPALYSFTPPYNHDLELALERSGGATPAMLKALRDAHAQPSQFIATKFPELEHTLEFTRPLTRYADLLNERILALVITKLSSRKRELLEEHLPTLAVQLAALEQNAARAEASLDAYIRAQQIADGAQIKGIVTGLDPWGLDFALENGAKARLAVQDMDEEYHFTDAPRSLKGRSGRVFKPGSIARAHVVGSGRAIRLSLGKENHMSKPKRSRGAKPGEDTPRRQVVVLHAKPRGEYQRNVRVTARKLYFGEWSRAQFVASDEFGGEIAIERPQPQQRPQHQSANRAARGNAPQQQPRGNAQRPQHNQPRPASANGAPANVPSRASRIAELKRRADATLERNANRTQRGPAEGTGNPRASNAPAPRVAPPQASVSQNGAAQNGAAQNGAAQNAASPVSQGDGVTPAAPRNRRRRRGGRGNKAPAA